MNTNRVLSILIAITLVITGVLVVQSAIDTSTVNARAKESLTFNTDAARWQALGEYYAKQKSAANFNIEAQHIREIASERWEAMGQAYTKAVSAARQADLARWVGLGEFYTNLNTSASMQFDAQHVRDINSARWEAMGQAYAKTVSPARQADLARWVAQGEYFTTLQSAANISFDALRIRDINSARWEALGQAYANAVSPARQADLARWVSLGEYYSNLDGASNTLAHARLVASARYTGLALQEYERTGNPNLLPDTISPQIIAELPSTIGTNSWKAVVEVK